MRKIFITTLLSLFCFVGYTSDVLTPENWTPQVTNEAVINSDRLDFDYEQYIATFTGNVVIQHPQFTAIADKIIVVFEKEAEEKAQEIRRKENSIFGKKAGDAQRRVKSAVAIGNVKAVGEDLLITCDRANYFKDNAMLRLTGLDAAPVVQKDGRTISGEIITMWLDDNRVETSGDIKVQIPASSTNLD